MHPDPRAAATPGHATADAWTPAGRWQTTRRGRFLAMDAPLRRAIALPLIPVTQLCWADLVLPGTDLGFLELPTFAHHPVHVGLMGGIQPWALSGARQPRTGVIEGVVHVCAPGPREAAVPRSTGPFPA